MPKVEQASLQVSQPVAVSQAPEPVEPNEEQKGRLPLEVQEPAVCF